MVAVKIDRKRNKCQNLCDKYNNLPFDKEEKREKILHKLVKEIKGKVFIQAPLKFEYGSNIKIGDGFYCNANLQIADRGIVSFGDNVFIGANCTIVAEIDQPVTIGNDVWIGSNVVVMPNVKIGNNVIISSRSVVTKDIPDHVVAGGNPCKPKIDVEKR